MTTPTTYTHHHRLIPRGVHLRPRPGHRVVVRRPSGRAPAWESVLELTASRHPTSLRDVEVDGRWSKEGWPDWRVDRGIEHSPNIFVGGADPGGDRHEGLVEIDGVTSIDAAGDGVQIHARAAVRVRGGRYTGARAGIAITAQGCDVEVTGASASRLDVEPDGQSRDWPTRLLLEDIEIEPGGDFDAGLVSTDAELVARRVGPCARSTIVDSVPPELATAGQRRHHLVDCDLGDCEITTPRAELIEGGTLGAVTLRWQTRYRLWAPGAIRLEGCRLEGAWTTVGYGRLELVGCAGALDLTVASFAGYDPGSHPIVIVRDGLTTTITATGRYAL